MIPVFTAHDSQVYYRGAFRTPDECDRLLARFRQVAADPADYFHADAKVLADQLEGAMHEAGYIQQERAA